MTFDITSTSINDTRCFTFTPQNDEIIEDDEVFEFTPYASNELDSFQEEMDDFFSITIIDDESKSDTVHIMVNP